MPVMWKPRDLNSSHQKASNRSTRSSIDCKPVCPPSTQLVAPVVCSVLPNWKETVLSRPLECHGKVMQTGLDTLSCSSLVSNQFLRRSGIHPQYEERVPEVQLEGLGGSTRPQGIVVLPVRLPAPSDVPVIDHVRFLVVDHLPTHLDAILGWRYLQERNIQIDCPANKIHVRGPLDTTTPLTPVSLGRATGTNSSA